MRFVAGRCAEAELLAGQGAVAERHREAVAGRGAVAERHQEAAADRGAVATEILLAGRCWQRRARLHREAAAGREDARLHREDAAGRGRLNRPLLL